MKGFSGHGKRKGVCGDTVEMFVWLSGGTIRRVSFYLDGCRSTLACADAVKRLAEGGTLESGWEISPASVIARLASLPPEKEHCADLAVGAFYLALADCAARGRSAAAPLYG